MRNTLENQRKALMALALCVATAAMFATSASAQVRVEASGEQADVSYLSWGATADDLGPFTASLANQSSGDGGPVFMNGVPDGYVGSGVEQNLSGAGVTPTNLARAYHQPEQSIRSGAGVTPTNLARAYHQPEQSVLSGAGVTPTNLARAYHRDEEAAATAQGTLGEWQLTPTEAAKIGVGRAFESESATVSASSDSLDRGDLALGFGFGLILATACVIALAMTRDRQRTRMAHS